MRNLKNPHLSLLLALRELPCPLALSKAMELPAIPACNPLRLPHTPLRPEANLLPASLTPLALWLSASLSVLLAHTFHWDRGFGPYMPPPSFPPASAPNAISVPYTQHTCSRCLLSRTDPAVHEVPREMGKLARPARDERTCAHGIRHHGRLRTNARCGFHVSFLKARQRPKRRKRILLILG